MRRMAVLFPFVGVALYAFAILAHHWWLLASLIGIEIGWWSRGHYVRKTGRIH